MGSLRRAIVYCWVTDELGVIHQQARKIHWMSKHPDDKSVWIRHRYMDLTNTITRRHTVSESDILWRSQQKALKNFSRYPSPSSICCFRSLKASVTDMP